MCFNVDCCLHIGTVIAAVTGSQVKLTLPRHDNYTNNITPLSPVQRAQLEYIMLLWLTGTPRPLTHIAGITGKIIL